MCKAHILIKFSHLKYNLTYKYWEKIIRSYHFFLDLYCNYYLYYCVKILSLK